MSELYDAYGSTLYGVALRLVRARDVAEDVVQETFVAVWARRDAFDSRKGTLFTWMLNIARNRCLDHLKSSGVRLRADAIEIQNDDSIVYTASLVADAPDYDRAMDVRDSLRSLPAPQQQLIDLVFFQGYTQQEVADEFNIPLGTVKSRLRLAMSTLRKVVGGTK